MKRTLPLILFFALFATALQAQVIQKHMALVTEATATWCNPCGTWGWQVQQQVVADNSSKAVILELQFSSSSGLHSTIAQALQASFSALPSTPAWYVNGKNRTVYAAGGGIYSTLTRSAIQAAVDSNFAVPALANCAYTKSISGNELTVNTTTKFFSQANGEYYLSVLLVEDNIVAYQNGIGSSAVHMNTVRGSMSATAFGELIATGSIPANSTYTRTYTTTLNTSWKYYNMRLAFIIWEKVGTQYVYVNSFQDGAPVGIGENEPAQPVFRLFPNPVTDFMTIEYDGAYKNDATVSVFDMQGKVILEQPIDSDHTLIDLTGFAGGLYLVQLKNSTKTEMIKVARN